MLKGLESTQENGGHSHSTANGYYTVDLFFYSLNSQWVTAIYKEWCEISQIFKYFELAKNKNNQKQFKAYQNIV